MNKNQIVVVSNSEAFASKTFLKNASIYGTDEYYILKGFKAENPNTTVKARTIRKKANKVSYKNLTYDKMVAYMNELPEASELINEFERQKRMSVVAKNPYRHLVNWFKNACFSSEEEFDAFREATAEYTVASTETAVNS